MSIEPIGYAFVNATTMKILLHDGCQVKQFDIVELHGGDFDVLLQCLAPNTIIHFNLNFNF